MQDFEPGSVPREYWNHHVAETGSRELRLPSGRVCGKAEVPLLGAVEVQYRSNDKLRPNVVERLHMYDVHMYVPSHYA